MQIHQDTVVVLAYQVWDLEGQLVDPGQKPMAYLHGGYDGVFPAIERALEGLGEGDSIRVGLKPEQGFGEYDDDLVRVESRSAFPDHIEVGMQFEGSTETDSEEFEIYRICEIDGDRVTVDGNHPLAGMTLLFQATVTQVRPALPQELAQQGVMPVAE